MFTALSAASALDRMFDDVMGSAFGAAMNARNFIPAIDVRTSPEEVVFICDVPGVAEEDLHVTLENHVLTLEGQRRYQAREGEQVVLGRAYGNFSRSFQLPDGLDESNLTAELAQGVLTIRVPRHPQAKPRKIPINGASSVKQLEE